MPPSPDYRARKIIFLVTEDWFFLSHFLDRAVAAKKAGYEVVVAARDNGRAREIEQAGFRFADIPFHRRGVDPPGEVRSIAAIRSLYRREQPDIVHQVALKPVIYGSLVRGNTRMVNAPVGMGFVFTSSSLQARLLRPLVRLALRFALNRPETLLVFENVDDIAELEASGIVDKARVRLIRGAGVDVEAFTPTEEPVGRFRVVLVARILRDKGVGEFVAAARLLRSEGRDFTFAIAGSPDPQNPTSFTEAELRAWRDEGIVELLGHRRDIPAVLAASNLVVLPSYREGLPKTLLEAMAAQRAIVATDVTGCREAVTDGVNGLLVPPRNVESLARAIAKLADDPALRQRLALAGRQRAETEFSSELIAAQTLELYRELLPL